MTALIVLLAVGCIPVLKLACMSVLYKLAAAVAEPVADIIAVTFTAVLFGNRFRKALERLSQEA